MLQLAYGRGLETTPRKDAPFTDDEGFVLQVLALIFSSISLLSAALTLYWFLLMRRTFRHDIIMFLIQSDMLKSLCLLVYAIRVLASGPIDNSSEFCQTNDFAVLMIALHSALCIFNPPTTMGEGGLYPYRLIAFVVWILFPALMASLAFVNPTGAYYAGPTTCYLPVRPFWYRLALDWIPRYIFFVTILAFDAAIYFHVRGQFKDFGTPRASYRSGGGQDLAEQRGKLGNIPAGKKGLPKTPPLVYNGLTRGTSESSGLSGDESRRCDSHLLPLAIRCNTEKPRWLVKLRILNPRPHNWSGAPASPGVPGTDESTAEFAGAFPTLDAEASPSAAVTPTSGPSASEKSTWSTLLSRFRSRSASKISFTSFLRHRPHQSGYPSGSSSSTLELELANNDLAQIHGLEARDKTRHQLRFLFIYPLAYLGMWALPFVSNCLQYNDQYAASPPFLLSVFVTIIIASQCAVDCLIFNLKEKPWRHLAQNRSLLRKTSIPLKHWAQDWRRLGSTTRGPQKSRNERAAEARVAYHRRDGERAAQANERSTADRGAREERSWWDELDPEGGEPQTAASDPEKNP